MQSMQAAAEEEPSGLERALGQGSQMLLPVVGRRVNLPMSHGTQEEEEVDAIVVE